MSDETDCLANQIAREHPNPERAQANRDYARLQQRKQDQRMKDSGLSERVTRLLWPHGER